MPVRVVVSGGVTIRVRSFFVEFIANAEIGVAFGVLIVLAERRLDMCGTGSRGDQIRVLRSCGDARTRLKRFEKIGLRTELRKAVLDFSERWQFVEFLQAEVIEIL